MSESTTPAPSVRDNFTEAEWNTLAATPILCAAAMSFSDKTGPWSMLQEMSAGAKAYTAGAKKFTESPLVMALGDSVNKSMFKDMEPEKGQSAEAVAAAFRTKALDDLGQALDLIEAKGAAADRDAYQNWVLGIAHMVMTESKSGSHFGIGGERVSGGEDAFFKELKAALGMTE